MASAWRGGQEPEESDEVFDNLLELKIKEDLHQREKIYGKFSKSGECNSENNLEMHRLEMRRKEREKHMSNRIRNLRQMRSSSRCLATDMHYESDEVCDDLPDKMLKLKISDQQKFHQQFYKGRSFKSKNENKRFRLHKLIDGLHNYTPDKTKGL